MEAGSVVVKLIADLTNFKANINQATRLIKGFVNTITHPIQSIEKLLSFRNIIVGGTIGIALKKLVDISAATEETETRFKIAFGGMSESVRAWSEQLGTSLKRSSNDIRDAAADLQFFLKNEQLTADESVNLSKQLTELGYALEKSARLPGSTAADAIWAMRMAMMGSERALHRYNLTIDDSAKSQWALKNGLNANTKEWTQQQHVIATVGALNDRLADDLAGINKGQDSLRTILRQVRDAWGEVSEQIGEKWRPMFKKFFEDQRDFLTKHTEDIVKWAEKLGTVMEFLYRSIKIFLKGIVTEPGAAWNSFLESLKTMLVVAAKIAVDTGLTIGEGLWKGIQQGMKNAVLGNRGAVEERAKEIYKSMGGEWQKVTTQTGLRQMPELTTEEPVHPVTWRAAQAQAAYQIPREARESLVDWEALEKRLGATLSQTADELAKIAKLAPGGAEWDKEVKNLLLRLQGLPPIAEDAAQGIDVVTQSTQRLTAATTEGYADTSAALVTMFKAIRSRGTEEIKAVNTLFEKMRQEKEILGELVQGHKDEAENIKIVNDLNLKATGGLLESEKRDLAGLRQTKRVQTAWIGAAESIASSFEDAFASIGKQGQTLRDMLVNLAESIRESFMRAIYQSTIGKGIESIVGKLTGVLGTALLGWGAGTTSLPSTGIGGGTITPATGSPGTMFAARGGLVYAASSFFRPRGTDSVPAMLTPGEAVLDRDTTNRLQKILGMGGASGGNQQVSLLQELVYQTKQQVNRPAAVVVVDQRENVAQVAQRHARRRGYLTRG